MVFWQYTVFDMAMETAQQPKTPYIFLQPTLHFHIQTASIKNAILLLIPAVEPTLSVSKRCQDALVSTVDRLALVQQVVFAAHHVTLGHEVEIDHCFDDRIQGLFIVDVPFVGIVARRR